MIYIFFSDISLGNYGITLVSSIRESGFIHMEKPDENGIAIWRSFNIP